MRYVKQFQRLVLLTSFLAISACTTTSQPIPLSTPDDAVFVTIDLQVDPEKVEEFLTIMMEAAPDTRAWEGCRLFDIYADQGKPGHVVFYEIWDSKSQQQAYMKWRQESGFNARVGPYMIRGGGGLKYFTKIDG